MTTRYAIKLVDMPTIGIAVVRSGLCPFGHDLTLPDSVSRTQGVHRCRACWAAVRGPELCKAGLHPKSPGVRACGACAAETHEGPKDMSYLFVGLPPVDVLNQAACSPEMADWFDPMERGGRLVGGATTGQLSADVARAMDICAQCPVRAACLEDALRWRREGVYGGAYFTRRWHQAFRSALRNDTTPPPLRTRDLVRASPRKAAEALAELPDAG